MGLEHATVMVNALFLDPGVSGGVETYVRALVPELARQAPDARFVIATTGRGAIALGADPAFEGIEILRFPTEEGRRFARLRAEQLALPRAVRRRGADLLWSPASVAPVVAGTRSVITVHDATMFEHDTFGALTTQAMRATIDLPARRADALIVGSYAARDQICRVLGLDPARFTIVPHGAGRMTGRARTSERAVRERYELPSAARVVLCVAAKRPHKNQELLIRALAGLPDDVILVLAGHPEPYDRTLRALAVEEAVAARVRFVDYVPDAELEGLFALADVAAFPSLAEGFGLPVVEAMARGVPVVAADTPVFREIGGDLVRFVDPYDAAAATTALADVLADGAAQRRGGPAWAARFTWEAAASGTLAVFDRVLAS